MSAKRDLVGVKRDLFSVMRPRACSPAHSPASMAFQNMIVDTIIILYAYAYAYRVPHSYNAPCTHLPLICRTSVRVSVIHGAIDAS